MNTIYMFLRNSFLLAASLTLAALSSQAQLTVDTGMAPTQMVQNLVGPGVQIFNVQVTAAPGSYGYYYSNNTELGTNEGLLLSTGQAPNAIGPNNSSGLPQIGPGGVCLNCSNFDNDFPGSQLLNEAQDRNTFDAAMIEFDIVPQGDSLRFSYTFASEEYLEWVNSPFNDVFGFYITGPNIGTDVNIALLPGTSQAVAINSVNHLVNTQYFFNNQNPFGQGVQFDGFTLDLAAAVGNLIPCETYHLKLIIADGSDRIYDSGVFVNRIESNPLIVLTTTAGGTDYMIEGCNNGEISFCRTIATPSDQEVVYWLGGTAVDGVDYEQIGDGIPLNPLTITIPANELCATIPVNTFDDGIFEGEEYLTIYLGNPLCSNLEVLDTVNFYLIDQLEVSITADPSEICAGLCTILNGTAITDGTSSFTWSPTTGMDDPLSLNPQVCPTETTTYTLTSQVASCFGEASITISVSQIQLEFEVTNDNCQNANTGAINLSVLDAIDPLSFEWTGPNDFVSADQNLTGLAPGEYCVTVTDAGGCVATGCVTVEQNNELAFESETLSNFVCFPISCFGASDGSINIEITGGVPDYSYEWSGPNDFTANTQDVTGLSAGVYSVTITDAAGCTLTDTFTLQQPEPLSLQVLGEVDLLCSGAETGSAEVAATGGCSPYFYSWSHDPNLEAPVALNLGSGIYTVSVSDVNGCTSEGSVEIEINEPIDPVNITVESVLVYPGGFNVSCPDAADGALDVTIAGGLLPYTISWTGPNGFSSSQEDLIDIACGTYLLTVTDANECVITQTVTLSCVPQIQITSEVEPNPCLDPEAGVGTITILTTTGGHGEPYFYEWVGPEGFIGSGTSLTGLISGVYTLTVTDPFGCTRDFNITVGTNDAFEVTAIVADATCAGSCNGSINLTIDPAGEYNFTWSGPNGSLAGTEDQFGLCAGSYVVEVETAGCTGEFQYTIVEPAPIVIDLVSSVTPPCFGQNTGSIDIDISGGTGALSVSWAAVPESFFPGSSNEDLTSLFDGCYTVTVTDENGCTESATFCLDAPQVMIISVEVTEFNGGFNVSCPDAQDGQISVTVSGGTPDCDQFAPFCYTYDWSNCSDVAPNDPNSNLLTGLSGGVYCVDVFDANGCLATTTITLVEPEPIQDNAIVENVSCIGLTDGSITPNLNGGSGTYIDFDWTQGDIGSNAPDATTLTNLVPGCYTLVVTDNNQCTQEFTWCVEEPELLELSIDQLIFPSCEVTTGSAFFSANGGTPNFSFVTTGPGGPFFGDAITGLEAGSYTVTVTDAGGCTDSDTFEIELVEEISVTINAIIQDPGQIFTLQCTGDANGSLEAVVTGGAPEFTFVWTDETLTVIGNSATLTGLGAGTYCVEVTDQNGCSASECFTITEPEFPLVITSEILTYGDYNVSCFGECDGSIDLTVSGGVEPYVFLWELGDGTLNTDEDQFALCAGATEVLVTDANGCSQLIQFILTSPTPIVIESIVSQFDGGFNVSCNGACDGSISVSALGGDGVLSFEWTNPVLPGGTEQSDLCAGSYTVVVTDERGCQETAIITIAEPEILEVSISSEYDCTLAAFDLCANATGGSGNYSFDWSEGSTGQCISVTTGGEFCVTVTDSNGCQATICITVATPELLSASAIVTPATCGQPNGAINVVIDSGTGPFTFEWTGTGTVDGQEDQSGLGSGNYSVTITDGFGCTVELTVQVTQGDNVLVEVVSENLLCFRDSSGAIEVIITNGLDPISYTWTLDGDPFSGDNILTDLSVGTYVLNWSDANGCSGTETVVITQPSPISINADISLYDNGFNISTNGGSDGAISTEVSGGTPQYSYNWSFDPLDGTPGGNNLAAGTYELTVTDGNGCVTDTTIILTEPFELALPTGLSPNGDGDNDTYVILGIEGFEKNEFRVFNRWGSLVYEKNNYNNEWGGESKNGEMLADGTYFVVFVAGGFEFNTYVDLRR